jgi:predicted RNA-binding Zn-ribbon protein involved in translation (DUF1610 family)
MLNFKKSTPQIPVVLASLILWVSFAWGLPAEAPAAEGEAEVAPKDPWAGVRISDAYGYAECPYCGEKNELRAERCTHCGKGLPQPSAEITDPAWVFVPGKGYYREGTLVEPVKANKGLQTAGLVLSVLGVSMIVVGSIWGIGTAPKKNGVYAGLGATAVGVIMVVVARATRTKPVYAFESGELFEPYEPPAFALRSADSDGVALKVEVTLLSF